MHWHYVAKLLFALLAISAPIARTFAYDEGGTIVIGGVLRVSIPNIVVPTFPNIFVSASQVFTLFAADNNGRIDCTDTLVPAVNGAIDSPYGPRNGGFHDGIDIPASAGTAVLAAQSGVVVDVVNNLSKNDHSTPNGNFVRVNNTDGTQSVYIHLKLAGRQIGDTIQPGFWIGTVNNTGSSNGNHLHCELKANQQANSSTIDPETVYTCQ